MRYVYADNAATTPVSKKVVEAMLPYMTEHYGNPSSLYGIGQTAARAVDKAREQVAAALGADAKEIFFTSGGSEADNWAIKGAAALGAKKGKKHLITTKFEHHAVLHTMAALEKEGFTVTYLDVYENGIVKVEDVEKAITDETCLVTIMYANNEIGTVQPIAEIGKLCRDKGVLFHTDAVQAVGHIKIDVKEQNIDMLSLSGHKFHAVKGTGALYCKKGLRLPNLIEGGAQEAGRRAGTENVPGIVGLGVAITEQKAEKMRTLFVTFFPNRICITAVELLILPMMMLPYFMPYFFESTYRMNVTLVFSAPDALMLSGVFLIGMIVLSIICAPMEREFDADIFKKAKDPFDADEQPEQYEEDENNWKKDEDELAKEERSRRIRELLGQKKDD